MEQPYDLLLSTINAFLQAIGGTARMVVSFADGHEATLSLSELAWPRPPRMQQVMVLATAGELELRTLKVQVSSFARTLSVAVRGFRGLHELRHGHIADRSRFSRDSK